HRLAAIFAGECHATPAGLRPWRPILSEAAACSCTTGSAASESRFDCLGGRGRSLKTVRLKCRGGCSHKIHGLTIAREHTLRCESSALSLCTVRKPPLRENCRNYQQQT